MTTEIEKALNNLKKAMEKDSDYAWGWHCNIAMASFDEGLPLPAANRAAARFMSLAFEVDTTKDENFREYVVGERGKKYGIYLVQEEAMRKIRVEGGKDA